jgi:tetratricopeptide (TPR) repeat protein
LLYTLLVHASRTVAAAQHLFRSQQYTGVAALCADALEIEPDNLELRILRVRALLALRRDEEATRELSRILRWGGETAETFRMLGELAIRRGKLLAAETFLRQSLRLAPAQRKTQVLLELVRSSNQPTVAVEKLPAATATVGCTLSPEDEALLAPTDEDVAPRAPRLAMGTDYTPRRSQDQLDGDPADPFGRYLVDIGTLTPVQLYAALDYQRRAGVTVGDAAIALGFASAQLVEGAAQAFHFRLYNNS